MGERILPDHAQKEATAKIHQQRATREGGPRALLHESLQAVAGQSARNPKDDQQSNAHGGLPFYFRGLKSKKLLDAAGGQESSVHSRTVQANSIASKLSPGF